MLVTVATCKLTPNSPYDLFKYLHVFTTNLGECTHRKALRFKEENLLAAPPANSTAATAATGKPTQKIDANTLTLLSLAKPAAGLAEFLMLAQSASELLVARYVIK